MYIFDNYGVELKFKQIFSRGKDCVLSDEEYEFAIRAEQGDE